MGQRRVRRLQLVLKFPVISVDPGELLARCKVRDGCGDSFVIHLVGANRCTKLDEPVREPLGRLFD